jgi:hypothetical protein
MGLRVWELFDQRYGAINPAFDITAALHHVFAERLAVAYCISLERDAAR